MHVRDGLGDKRPDGFGQFPIPSDLGFDVDLEVVERRGEVGRQSPEPLREVGLEIADAQIADSDSRPVHFGRIGRADSLLGGAEI